MSARVAPGGTWGSPLSARDVAAESVRLGDLACDGDDVLWVEGRPAEAGRSVLVRCAPDGTRSDLLAEPFSCRTRVHEYGGGAFVAAGGSVWFSNLADQRLWRLDRGEAPRPVTPDDGRRWADATLDPTRPRLVAVCEDGRGEGEPRNTLAALSLDGRDPPHTLVWGHDFFSTPRFSPDGKSLAWLSWDHPDMPWDATTLWVAQVAADGALAEPRRVAGGDAVSVFQPCWSPNGDLHFVSDEGGWWNPRRERDGVVETLCEREAEFGQPQWVFGMSTCAPLADGRLVCCFAEAGSWSLGVIEPGNAMRVLDLPFTTIHSLKAAARGVVFLGGSPTAPEAIVRLDPDTEELEILRRSSELEPDPRCVSAPESLDFPTGDGERAYGFLYRPRNPEHALPHGTAPPLLVKTHGGPTGAVAAAYDPQIQYWTTRGFAVFDVNYRGSTGYGRAYRDRLRGAWGVVDVDDCASAARELAARGDADPERTAIRGGSAGGYTVLCALAFCDIFRAGASYYGVSDLEALARDTHKFEAHYLDRLVGRLPDERDVYRARSPLYHADRIDCPVVFFQGSADIVVPPDQAESMVAALRKKGLDVAYVVFEGEAHGFRRGDNIAHALDTELAFYLDVFGLA